MVKRVHILSGQKLAWAMLKHGIGFCFCLGVPCVVSWCDSTLREGICWWVSGSDMLFPSVVGITGIVFWMCVIFGVGWVVVFCVVVLVCCMYCRILSANVLLIVAIFVRMCCLCVTCGGLSLRYIYRFLAVF